MEEEENIIGEERRKCKKSCSGFLIVEKDASSILPNLSKRQIRVRYEGGVNFMLVLQQELKPTFNTLRTKFIIATIEIKLKEP